MAPAPINRPPGPILPGLPRTESAPAPSTTAPGRIPSPPVLDRLERTGSNPALRDIASSGPAGMARVQGSVTTPAVVMDPVQLMGQMKKCDLSVKLPLKHTADLGRWLSVREGTQAMLHLAVADGKIDFKNTKFEIKDDEGKDYSLDGPLWLDPESVYIDDDGQLRAKMPCFPDPNITKQLLGPDAKRVPDDPGEFLQRITQGKDVAFEVMPSNRVGGAANVSGAAAMESSSPTVEDSQEPNPLEAFTDLQGVNFDFSGELKAGPLKLGPGALLNLREGTSVQASGTLGDMRVSMEAPVKSMQLAQGDTRIQSGNGTVKMDVHFTSNADEEVGIDLQMHAFELANFQMQAAASQGAKHQIGIGKLDIENEAGHPLITMRSEPGAESHLSVDIDRIGVEDLTGKMVVDDTRGEQVELKLGRLAAGSQGPMNVEASLKLDSSEGTFSLLAQADDVAAEVGRLGLLDTGLFDLTLDSGRISGSGSIGVTQNPQESRLTMKAAPGEPWAIETDIHDAHLGMETEGAKVHADLSADTFGTIHLQELDISPHAPPILDATAEFKVALDELTIPLGPDNKVSLKKGTEGTLVISEMSWKEGDKSPAVEAELRLNVGTDALMSPGDIPGLEGARVELDVDTGDSILVLKAKLSREGELVLDCGFSLRNVELKTDLRRGESSVIPLATLPAEPLGPIEAFEFKSVRKLTPKPELLALPAANDLALPQLSRVSIEPVGTLGVLDSASIDISIPVDGMSKLRVLDYDATETVSRFGIADDVGAKVKIDFTRAAGPIAGSLAVAGGALLDGQSRLTLDPPLSMDIWAQYHLPGPLAPSTDLGAMVYALEVRVDEDTGEAYLWPEVDLSGLLPGAAEAVGLGDTVRREIGAKLGEALVGSSPFPADVESFLEKLSANVTVLRDPIIVDPNASVETAPVNTAPQDAANASTPGELDALLAKIDFASTDITVRNASFSDNTLSLGDGQSIQFAPGSQISVEGNPNDLTIRGHANLGQTILGNDDLGVNIGNGDADVLVRVYRDENGDAHFELAIDNLDASDVSLRAAVGSLRSDVSVDSVQGGQVRIAYHPGEEPVFELDLPKVQATLNASGSVCIDDHGGSIALGGKLSGSIGIKDGKLSGRVDDLDLTADGSGAISGTAIGNRGVHMSMSLKGSGSFETDENGEIHFASKSGENSLKLNTQMQAADGSILNIDNGSVATVSVGLENTDIAVTGLRGGLSGLIHMPIPDENKPPALIDIRSAQVSGGSLQIGAGTISTPDKLVIENLDASIIGLDPITNKETDIEFKQIDIQGRASLNLGGDGALDLVSDGETPLSARAQVGKFRFTTFSPQFNLEMGPNTQIASELHHLSFRPEENGSGSVSVQFSNTVMDAELADGSVTVGSEGDAVRRLNLKEGTRVQATLGDLGIHTGGFATSSEGVDMHLNEQPTDIVLSGQLRLEGDLAAAQDIAPEAVAAGREAMRERDFDDNAIVVEELGSDGQVRIILGVHADRGESFVARSHTSIEGSFNTTLRTTIDPAALYKKALSEQ